jgi:hypothetical protein
LTVTSGYWNCPGPVESPHDIMSNTNGR